ncbi:hypothetical protein DPMN_141074 [Dreissena polymorpha]|uniref:Uncharacterized protein n=1 Tax=Dreissena polymorpha TaxID=45954 RepID=A0A9D4GC34_DREPO|nr:hypothetical protein DPMN_141074 [Dreissena polymorpha]
MRICCDKLTCVHITVLGAKGQVFQGDISLESWCKEFSPVKVSLVRAGVSLRTLSSYFASGILIML